MIYGWWDDAIDMATVLARGTLIKHRVTAIRDMVAGQYVVTGWLVDIALDEQATQSTAEPTPLAEVCS